jgi:hypothetical protein
MNMLLSDKWVSRKNLSDPVYILHELAVFQNATFSFFRNLFAKVGIFALIISSACPEIVCMSNIICGFFLYQKK